MVMLAGTGQEAINYAARPGRHYPDIDMPKMDATCAGSGNRADTLIFLTGR